MTTHDMACFETWLEKHATAAERALNYEEQVRCHIYWLSGFDDREALLEQIPPDAFGDPQ